jgi:hypothetical protein
MRLNMTAPAQVLARFGDQVGAAHQLDLHLRRHLAVELEAVAADHLLRAADPRLAVDHQADRVCHEHRRAQVVDAAADGLGVHLGGGAAVARAMVVAGPVGVHGGLDEGGRAGRGGGALSSRTWGARVEGPGRTGPAAVPQPHGPRLTCGYAKR